MPTLLEEAEEAELSVDEVAEFGAVKKEYFRTEQAIGQSLKQKARLRWAVDRDENNKYFHVIVRGIYLRNSVKGLSINGTWIEDPKSLKEEVYSFFKDHFSEKQPDRPDFFSAKFKTLTDVHNSFLDAPFTAKEIKQAVWSCDGSKALRPYGFTFTFVKKHRDPLEPDVVIYVKEFERKGRLSKGFNSIFLTLVPKVSNSVTLHDYRPISLVG